MNKYQNHGSRSLSAAFVFLLVPGIIPCHPSMATQDHAITNINLSAVETAAETDLPDVWQRVEQLFDTYDQNALQPVVRQQFMLAIASSFYEIAGRPVPATLRHEVALLSTSNEFRDWLATNWDETRPDRMANSQGIPLLDRISRAAIHKVAPGSRYVSGKENRVARQLADNQYVGIGIQVQWDADKAMIIDPFRGGAAFLAGARPNDYILSVDGESMKGSTLRDVIEVLRGSEGSKVSVVVRNKDNSEPRKLDMVRTVIPIPSVLGVRQNDDGSWEYLSDDSDSQFAYMKIDVVKGSTSAELREAARKAVSKGAKGILLDLRNLRAGSLHQINLVADTLVGEGTFATLTTASGSTRQLVTRADSDFEGMPIAVLTSSEPVTGPVFALLSAIQRRPQTALIGTPVGSNLKCFDTFELSENAGAIADVAYAVVKPPADTARRDQGRSNLLGQPMTSAGLHLLHPTFNESEPSKKLESARSFLKRESGARS